MLISAAILANQCVIGSLYRQTNSETTANAVKLFCDDDLKPGVDSGTNRPSKEIELREHWAHSSFQYAFYGYPFTDGRRRSSINMIRGHISRSSIQIANGIKRSNAVAIFKNIRFVSFSVSTFLNGFAFFGCTVHFVALCVDSGISKVDAAFLLSLMGIFGAIARLSHGIFIDKKLVSALNFLSLSKLTAGVSCILIGISPTFVTLVIFAIVFGASSGILFPTTLNAMRQIVDIHLMKGGLGIVMAVGNMGGLLGVPTTGKYWRGHNWVHFTHIGYSVLLPWIQTSLS